MSKTVLIGLDGATFTVLDALFQRGDMPFLRDFLDRGASAELSSTVFPITPAAWTSMITGRTPGNHGIFDFIHVRQNPEGVFFTLNMSYDIRCPTLWSILSRQGMRVASLNFPVAFPPEPMNGVCVPGFVHWRHLKKAVYPPAFYERMSAAAGFDPKFLSMDTNQEFQSIQYLPPERYEEWIAFHTEREARWFELMRLILSEDPPDLTAVVFDGVDKLQHLCWRFLDPALLPDNPTPWESRILGLCRTYFRQLDGFIRRIVALAGENARVFIASDHGFGPTETVFFANAWLAQNGYLVWKNDSRNGAATATNIADQRIKFQVEEIDWSRSTAFCLNPSCNGVYVRQSDGTSPGVKPEEYLAFRTRLATQLAALRDPCTGGPFFRSVLTREQAFPGDAAARAPDLTLLMNDNGFLSVLDSDTVFRQRPEPWGTHYPQGIFAAAGPGIARLGRMPGLRIVDVAPILLRSVGAAAECEMEGRCPEGLFERTFAASSAGAAFTAMPPAAEMTSDAELEAEVLKKLQALGYMEE